MRWFSPLERGRLSLRTRTWVPAMVPWRATSEGYVSPAVLDWYGRFARGKPGAIVVEATGIRDIPSGPLLRASHERYVDGLRELVARVHEESEGETKLFIQLIDFLRIKRRPPASKFFLRFMRVDAQLRERLRSTESSELTELTEPALRQALLDKHESLRGDARRAWLAEVLDERELESLTMGMRERVTDMHVPEIAALPQTLPKLFADAAERAERAGFDGIELHYAHAYTMASFLSAKNTRSDGYGGARENRVRLPLEVLETVRSRLREESVLGLRFLGDEVIEGGSGLDDAMYFAERFAEAGADFLSVSKGGKFEDAKQPRVGHAAYPYTGESGHECMPTVKIKAGSPFSRNVPLAAAITKRVAELGLSTPVVTAGGIATSEQAEGILKRGDADIVAAARQTLADPDWFAKIRSGQGAEVRRCFFTNYCEALDQAHKEVTCQRWDKEGLDVEGPSMSQDGKRRLIAP